ncbi:hypothetical protein ABL78_3929 [Leptomonas seymouri]|uniref:Uncharacterized protein n=1 Tax=Leptomonas seymouri TaxID=5684 RepID=A0A0N0P6D0_LEPSE|nr:hypothetical protein ABL78_3929 [Leptomonas seymouri]|eukprot:KPI87017.1 hypothetical protein ABL78_3929 [Leptomonas seymouri]
MMIVGSTTRLRHVPGVTTVHTHTPKAIYGRCRAADSATGTHPGRPRLRRPTHGTVWVAPPPHTHADTPHCVHLCGTSHARMHLHTSSRSPASTSPRTIAAASSNAHMRTPSRLRARTRTLPTAAAGDAKKNKTRGPKANPLHPPFSVTPRSRTRCPVPASAGHAAHRAHDRLLHWGAVRTPRARTGPERKSLAHTRAAAHTSCDAAQAASAGCRGQPQWHRRTHPLLARRAAGPPAAVVRLPLDSEGPGVCISAPVPCGPVCG